MNAITKAQPSSLTTFQRLSLPEILQVSEVVFASKMFRLSNPQEAAVKIMMGQELGLPVIFSLTRIFTGGGPPDLDSLAVRVLLHRAGYDWQVVEQSDKWFDGEKGIPASGTTIQLIRNGEPVGIPVRYTIQDAFRSGDWGKSGSHWKVNPRRMTFNSAIREAARMFVPEIYAGAEIVEDFAPQEVDQQWFEDVVDAAITRLGYDNRAAVVRELTALFGEEYDFQPSDAQNMLNKLSQAQENN